MNETSSVSGQPIQDACRATFLDNDKNPKLAELIEEKHPQLVCEAVSVSQTSPGPIHDNETLWRVIVSPRDIDDKGFVAERPFYKVFENGLSAIRSVASADEVAALVTDGMYSKPEQPLRQIQAVLAAPAGGEDGLRSLVNDEGDRTCGVYDQTVPLEQDKSKPHVPTHAGVFLRLPPPNTPNGKAIRRGYAAQIKELFERMRPDLGSIHDGLLEQINDEAANGAFVKPHDTPGGSGAAA